jgi:hypothetical protein
VIVIVLVCIATATLFVVLAVELGKLVLGTERENVAVDRLLHGVAGGVKGVLGVTAAATVRPPSPPIVAEGQGATEAPTVAAEDQTWLRHDLEVEQQVRDRLYGAGRLSDRRD